MLIPIELMSNIEKIINKKIVKFVAKELVIKKFNPLKAMVINKTTKKPSLTLRTILEKIKSNDDFRISLIRRSFFIIN